MKIEMKKIVVMGWIVYSASFFAWGFYGVFGDEYGSGNIPVSNCNVPHQEWGSVDGVARTFLCYREDVDYSKIAKDVDVVLFGESHPGAQVKIELAQNMSLFKQLGFTCLGLEMFSTDVQDMLDEYFRTGKNREELLQYLKDVWGYSTAEYYMKLIEAARKNGIRIIALDMPKQLQEQLDVVEWLDARDKYMSKTISEILAEDGGRMLVLCGKGHLKGIKSILEEKHGLNVVSVFFVGGKQFLQVGDIPVNEGDVFDNGAREAGLDGEKFMVKVESTGELDPQCDWIIHLPQTEPPSPEDIRAAAYRAAFKELEVKKGELFDVRLVPPDPEKGGYKDKPVTLFPDLPYQVDEYNGIVMHKDGKRYLFIIGESPELCIVFWEKRESFWKEEWTTKERPMTIKEYYEFKEAIEKAIEEDPSNEELKRIYQYFPQTPPDYLLKEEPTTRGPLEEISKLIEELLEDQN
jgi:hypothetical protein